MGAPIPIHRTGANYFLCGTIANGSLNYLAFDLFFCPSLPASPLVFLREESLPRAANYSIQSKEFSLLQQPR